MPPVIPQAALELGQGTLQLCRTGTRGPALCGMRICPLKGVLALVRQLPLGEGTESIAESITNTRPLGKEHFSPGRLGPGVLCSISSRESLSPGPDAWVCSGCHDSRPQPGWLQQQEFISHSSGGCKPQTKVPVGWASVRPLSVACGWQPPSWALARPFPWGLLSSGHWSYWVRAPPPV